ncbi:MAG: WecB/TagA/CpsF family glycosyltransferase [Candidatus Obscuribacterales bacterium]|nr:WecB/TagA/CpsF family glycosyltransferase [Candidatus Obscuribacterales bacterium]
MQTANVLGVLIDLCSIEQVTELVLDSASKRESLGIAPMAMHSIVAAVRDQEFRYRVNSLDAKLADGSPVFAMAWLLSKQKDLVSRIRGHDLMKAVLKQAAQKGVSVYLFGGRADTLALLESQLPTRYPGLKVSGTRPGRYRILTDDEAAADAQLIKDSGASIVFVGLGSPLQETWIYENRHLRCAMIGLGSAFDYEAGLICEPPALFKQLCIEWTWRLYKEPARLWRRYLLQGPLFLCLALLQLSGLRKVDTSSIKPEKKLNVG